MNQPGPSPDAGARLLSFAERIFGAWGLSGRRGDGPPRAQLLPGAVPRLPFALPLPAGAVLVGSLVLPAVGQPGAAITVESALVLLDVPDATVDVFRFYDDAFHDAGWSAPAPTEQPSLGGFADSLRQRFASRPESRRPPEAERRGYCGGPNGPSVAVTEWNRRDGAREVRITIRMVDLILCRGSTMKTTRNLPQLTPPPGMELHIVSAGNGGDHEHSEGWLDTTWSAGAVERHFAEQLAAAGWQQRGAGTGGIAAWSTWSVPSEGDQRLRGVLSVLEDPERPRRWLHVYSEPEHEASAMWTNPS